MSTYFTLSKAGLEVYTVQVSDEKEKTGTSSSSEDTETDISTNFQLDNGDITNIDFIGEIYSDSFEEDYGDISCSASVSVHIAYLHYFYKGRRIALKKGLQEETLKWEDMSTAVTGYITEISYSRDKADIKITGFNKLLDENAVFKFSKTKRSEIVRKIIETAGLKAKIDITGLKDDVIDFTSGSEESGSSDVNPNASKSIQEIVQKVCGDETDELEKFKKLHKWGQDEITYDGYECSRYDNDPDTCLNNKDHLNCGDTSILMHAIYSAANLECYINHGNYHFWNIVIINGKKYASDCSGSHAINQVWSTSKHPNSPFSGSKANPNAICG